MNCSQAFSCASLSNSDFDFLTFSLPWLMAAVAANDEDEEDVDAKFDIPGAPDKEDRLPNNPFGDENENEFLFPDDERDIGCKLLALESNWKDDDCCGDGDDTRFALSDISMLSILFFELLLNLLFI